MDLSIFGTPGLVQMGVDASIKTVTFDNDAFPAIITKITVDKSRVVQVLHTLDGSNYAYDFGGNPYQCTIQGVTSLGGISQKKLSALVKTCNDYVNVKRDQITPVTVTINNGESFKGLVINFSYSIDSENVDMAFFSMTVLGDVKGF